MTSKRTVNIITLGCSKNLIDSERLMKMFYDSGFLTCHEPKTVSKNDIVVINTCGFIGDAKEESVNTILEWCEAKSEGKISQLYVMGCLSQRYRDDLISSIPEVDGWYGKTDWPELVSHLAKKHPATASYDRIITTPRHHAYLKIAEGCNRFCSFCAIPLITGRYRSRSIEDIEAEVKMLVSRGVKEFNVIAQDLSYYGTDIYGKQCIAELVDRIAQIDGVKWIRLHYAYPSQFPMDLLDVMASRDNVCRYLDIALQHISDTVLSNMRRHYMEMFLQYMITIMQNYLKTTDEKKSIAMSIKEYVDEHYAENIHRDCLTDVFFLDPNYASKIFKKEMGISFKDYIIQKRIDTAKDLLQNTNLPVNTVANNVGYDNYSYFSRIFKKVTDMTPIEYRNKATN